MSWCWELWRHGCSAETGKSETKEAAGVDLFGSDPCKGGTRYLREALDLFDLHA